MLGTFPGKDIILELREYTKTASNVSSVTTEELEIKTDWKGSFSCVLEPDPKSDCYSIKLISEPTLIVPPDTKKPLEFYLETGIEYTTCEAEIYEIRKPSQWWIWLILAIAIIVVGWLIYRYLKRRNKIEIPPEMLPPAEEFEIPITEEAEESEFGGDITRLTISFAGIEETLPDVWGVDESLIVNFKLRGEKVNPVSSRECEIDWGDDETIRLVSDEGGNINSVHVFTLKGKYVINASYKEDASGQTISSWRKIRIVDYREEMVRLFNEMLERLELTDISIGSEMTPREIEEILKPGLEGVGEITIRNLITGFEEANYSTHPVTRDSYVVMYRAIREVI